MKRRATLLNHRQDKLLNVTMLQKFNKKKKIYIKIQSISNKKICVVIQTVLGFIICEQILCYLPHNACRQTRNTFHG